MKTLDCIDMAQSAPALRTLPSASALPLQIRSDVGKSDAGGVKIFNNLDGDVVGIGEVRAVFAPSRSIVFR